MTKIGIIGCGNISAVYFKNCRMFDGIEVKACADLDRSKAEERAKEFEVPHVYSVEELLNDDEIELVINLTIPKVHAAVCRQVLEAGKHVYVEKPLAIDVADGEQLLALADAKGLRVGCAPDTFLGAGIQTCRQLIDEGAIGRPLHVSGFMMGKGHESWHPSPAFYYERGGGPMYDMGPYYLTALVQLLGPMKRVTGSTAMAFEERTITSKPLYGQKIKVETPTHLAGTIDFESGAVGTLIMSFDTFTKVDYPNIEIYGTEGTLRVPDPNGFGGTARLRKKGAADWEDIALSRPHDGNSRGIGVMDMVYAIRSGREHRANGRLGLHVLEAMYGFHAAAESGRHYVFRHTCAPSAPVSAGGIVE